MSSNTNKLRNTQSERQFPSSEKVDLNLFTTYSRKGNQLETQNIKVKDIPMSQIDENYLTSLVKTYDGNREEHD